jgi:hypothetical protein
MGFTVTHQGGTNGVNFEEYARLLRQKGVDLAHLRRVPEPGGGRRWLHVWDERAKARAFAEELKKRTGDGAWEVVEVNGPASEGPLGPVEISVGLQRDGLAFALHPLSRQVLRKLFPGSCRADTVFVGAETPEDLEALQAGLPDLSQQVAVLLTGLSLDKLAKTFGGYRVYDARAKKELAASGPVAYGGGPPA